MDQFRVFVTDSLEKYDKNGETYDNMFRDVHYVRYIINDSEIDYDQVIFYDKDEKKLIDANYEIAGTYFVENGIWVWAWSDASYNKKLVSKSKNLLLYGLKLSSEQNFNLKMELVNSRFIITDPIQIDVHLAIASELSKNPCVFRMPIPIKAEDIVSEEFLVGENKYAAQEDVKLRVYKDDEIDDIRRFKFVYFFVFNLKENAN